MKVDFYYTNVDQLEGDERMEALEDLKKWNPRRSFPSLVINNSQCIIGYDENQIRKALKP